MGFIGKTELVNKNCGLESENCGLKGEQVVGQIDVKVWVREEKL